MRLTPVVFVSAWLSVNPALAQRLPPAPRAARVQLLRQPRLESAHDDLAVVRWSVNNPGGLDVHYGVVHFGTAPGDLSRTAVSPVRLNRGHTDAVFRVRLIGLAPRTTYYYKVSSVDSDGRADGVESALAHFTTPGPNERFRDPQAAR
jgi:hypothetical protein